MTIIIQNVVLKIAVLSIIFITMFILVSCENEYSLTEAFLPNGDETRLFSHELHRLNFGQAVAIEGDAAFVNDSSSPTHLYRFDDTTWILEKNFIGSTVAVDGDLAAVGLPFQGEVKIYRFNGSEWQLDGSIFENIWGFGSSVAIHGQVLAVGIGSNSAYKVVYIYRHDGTDWVYETFLSYGSSYYYALDVYNDFVIVGVPDYYSIDEDSDMAIVYKYTGIEWEISTIISSQEPGARFGIAVAINDNFCVIGAPLSNFAGESSGLVYVCSYDGEHWQPYANLYLAQTDSAFFGMAVDIEDGNIIIGAPYCAFISIPYTYYNYVTVTEPGRAYVYERDGQNWNMTREIMANDGHPGDGFGSSVAISWPRAIIGAPYSNSDANADYWTSEEGAAYIYDLEE